MLSTRLAALIANLGLKHKSFAERIGFSNAYITMILNGNKTSPSQRFYDTISREFHVNGEWLKNGKGEMFEVPGTDMSSTDAELITKYRLLLPPERYIVDEIVDAMLLKSMCKQEQSDSQNQDGEQDD
ncbi:MAG: helix-turn-helix transcriptional regulator [Clostridiales bacterium]|jgi:transcriptional regulator with XRE-family HTH domain|nr:helix-turn-helix transcriptional regulator [Clostridiales bacterium]